MYSNELWYTYWISTVSELFSWIYCRILSKKFDSLTIGDFSKNFFVQLPKQYKWIRLCDANWIAWRNSWEQFMLGSLVESWSGQGTFWIENNIFAIVFAFCDSLLRLYQLEKCLKCVSAVISQPLLCARVTSGLPNNLLVFFSENFSRENTAFWEDFCFGIRCS